LAFGRAVVKVTCTNPPAFMMLKGPLTNSSGTLLGSETSIGPVGGWIAGIALALTHIGVAGVLGTLNEKSRRGALGASRRD
jgi:hypothetical protein